MLFSRGPQNQLPGDVELAKTPIGSHNIKNIRLLSSTKKAKVLSNQEHWLFQFEFSTRISIQNSTAARVVNEDNPLPLVQKPRGYGGTAIFQGKKLKTTKTITCIKVIA